METKNQAWLEKGLGKQLLLKMGWKEGEGLGAEGQGRKGNVTIRKAVEQRGLGFNNATDSDAGVVKQIHGLNEVLTSLQKEHDNNQEKEKEKKKKSKKRQSGSKKDEEEATNDEEKVEEDEEKPVLRVKRKRGYQKFLDAKDVSLYSKQDLKAILGGVQD